MPGVTLVRRSLRQIRSGTKPAAAPTQPGASVHALGSDVLVPIVQRVECPADSD